MASKYPKMYNWLKDYLKSKGINIEDIFTRKVQGSNIYFEQRCVVCNALYHELCIDTQFIGDIVGLTKVTVAKILNVFTLEDCLIKHKGLYEDLINNLIKEVDNVERD